MPVREAEPLYRRALSLWEQILDQKHSEFPLPSTIWLFST